MTPSSPAPALHDMNGLRMPRPRAQRGAAALIVVMLLFFVLSLVAAYAGRNLIFEQKTSANQYRATQAFEAAEAGIEWALAMLNGGRIDAACTPPDPPDNTAPSFRQRYLAVDAASGNVTPIPWADGVTAARPSCVHNGTGWNCSCPVGAAPAPELPTGSGTHPAFRVCLEAVDPPQAGVVRIVSTGRTSFVDQPCEERGTGTASDAAATVSVVVALNSALASPPMAALTAGGNVSNFGGLTLVNTDPQANGLTANLGGSLPNWPFQPPVLVTLPGSSASRSSVENDTNLEALSPQQLFTSVFRMAPDTFKNQPAAVRLDNCASSCRDKLVQAVEANPGRIVWVDGDLGLEAELDLDNVDPPVLIVAGGNVNLYARARIRGVLVSLGRIDNYATDTRIHGAVVAADEVRNFGSSTSIEYDPTVVKQLKLGSGSLVRVPGSWRDFP
jgi:Tfp pilus assembly protein PilX